MQAQARQQEAAADPAEAAMPAGLNLEDAQQEAKRKRDAFEQQQQQADADEPQTSGRGTAVVPATDAQSLDSSFAQSLMTRSQTALADHVWQPG